MEQKVIATVGGASDDRIRSRGINHSLPREQ